MRVEIPEEVFTCQGNSTADSLTWGILVESLIWFFITPKQETKLIWLNTLACLDQCKWTMPTYFFCLHLFNLFGKMWDVKCLESWALTLMCHFSVLEYGGLCKGDAYLLKIFLVACHQMLASEKSCNCRSFYINSLWYTQPSSTEWQGRNNES